MSNVFVVDQLKHGLDPQQMAMIQSLYSRNPASMEKHLSEVTAKGAAAFMETFFVGYGHESIGQCGNVLVAVEEVSLLVPGIIQDHQLYNGQEVSTRYVDMSKQGHYYPEGLNETGKGIIASWMTLYNFVLDNMNAHLTETVEMPAGVNPGEWKKAVKARAFDIARAWIPLSLKTSTSWYSSLSNANSHTQQMLFHPLPEAVSVAKKIRYSLTAEYPESFSREPSIEYQRYALTCQNFIHYLPLSLDTRAMRLAEGGADELIHVDSGTGYQLFEELEVLLTMRPKYTYPDPSLKQCGQATISGVIDFGGFREIHRHRDGFIAIPRVTPSDGILGWYMDQLPESLRATVEEKTAKLIEAISIENCFDEGKGDENTLQYLATLGTRVPFQTVWALPQLIYFAELRSGATVHPTVRNVALRLADSVRMALPGMPLYIDNSPDGIMAKRGKQDIIMVSTKAPVEFSEELDETEGAGAPDDEAQSKEFNDAFDESLEAMLANANTPAPGPGDKVIYGTELKTVHGGIGIKTDTAFDKDSVQPAIDANAAAALAAGLTPLETKPDDGEQSGW